MSWIALGRIPTSNPFYRTLVKHNVLLHVMLQADHSQNYSFDKGYGDIAFHTGLHLSAVKRAVNSLCKHGAINKVTFRNGDRLRTRLFLNTEHELFQYLQTEPQTALQTEPQSEPQELSNQKASTAYAEPQAEPQAEPESVPYTTIEQYLHKLVIKHGYEKDQIQNSISLAQKWTDEWNGKTGKRKRISKTVAGKFLVQLSEGREKEILEKLCEFLPEEYLRWKDGDQFAFRSEDPAAFRNSDRFLARVRKMDELSETKNSPLKQKVDLPEHLKRIEDDPFYEPTQDELVEYQNFTQARS